MFTVWGLLNIVDRINGFPLWVAYTNYLLLLIWRVTTSHTGAMCTSYFTVCFNLSVFCVRFCSGKTRQWEWTQQDVFIDVSCLALRRCFLSLRPKKILLHSILIRRKLVFHSYGDSIPDFASPLWVCVCVFSLPGMFKIWLSHPSSYLINPPAAYWWAGFGLVVSIGSAHCITFHSLARYWQLIPQMNVPQTFSMCFFI